MKNRAQCACKEIGFIVIRHGFEIFMLKKITRNGNRRDIETEYKLTR